MISTQRRCLLKKWFFRFAVYTTLILIGLNICKLINMQINCVVCGEPTYYENVLCRFASQFDNNFIHDYCVNNLKFKRDNIDANISN